MLNTTNLAGGRIYTETNGSGNSIGVYFRPNNNSTNQWSHFYGGTGSGYNGAGGYGLFNWDITDYVAIYKANGTVVFPYGIEAAIMRDFNNTAYYDDPAGSTCYRGAGNILINGTITQNYSDERLKTKLGLIENALDKVMSLSGFYYEANEIAQQLGFEKKREVGISAQDVEKVLPEIVKPAPVDHKYLTIDYDKLTPLLIEAIKEQQSMIEGLRAEINALKSTKE